MSRDEVHGTEHLAARRAALLKAFKAFASRWPKFFAPARVDELLPVWLKAVGGVDVAMIEPAALDFAADYKGRYAPDPAEFGTFARAFERRLTRPVEALTVKEDRDVFWQAKAFWYAKPGREDGYGRLNADYAIAFQLRDGSGCLNIADIEMDNLYQGAAWGWLPPEEVPLMAAPNSFFRSWNVVLEGAA